VIAWLSATLVAVAVIGIFLTTRHGQRLLGGLGLHALRKNAAPKEDRDYLLRVCDDDPVRVEERLEAERAKNASLPEAQIYRNAIRTYMGSRSSNDR
jgi:hypothetical protein